MGKEGGNPPTKQNPFANATDRDLARAMAGESGEDDAAWREFMTRHGDRIMRLIRYIAPSMQEADRKEVFSDSIVRMQAAIGRFTPRGNKSLLSWAYKIAQNATYEWFRRERRVELVSVDDVAETLSVEVLGVDTTPESEAAQAALERALAKLSPRYQTLLSLSRAEHSDREIGARLGMAEDTVRKVRYKALVRLRELLIEERDARG
jgi:RNA polymerase sigma factor (sigma-70 family)